MDPADVVLRFLESVGSRREADFYLALFRAGEPERFAAISVDANVARHAAEAVTLDLRFLASLGLYPVVLLGLFESTEAMDHAVRLGRRLERAGVRALLLGAHEPDAIERATAATRAQTIPILTFPVGAEARFETLAALVAALQTRKLIFLHRPGGLRQQGALVPIVNLTTDYAALSQSKELSRKERALVEESRRLVERTPHRLSIAITSPLNLFRELFTIKGAGTLLRRGAIVERRDFGDVDRERLRALLTRSFGRPPVDDFFARPIARAYVAMVPRGDAADATTGRAAAAVAASGGARAAAAAVAASGGERAIVAAANAEGATTVANAERATAANIEGATTAANADGATTTATAARTTTTANAERATAAVANAERTTAAVTTAERATTTATAERATTAANAERTTTTANAERTTTAANAERTTTTATAERARVAAGPNGARAGAANADGATAGGGRDAAADGSEPASAGRDVVAASRDAAARSIDASERAQDPDDHGWRGAALVVETPLGAYLSKFAVDAEAQGEGIGRDLWQALASDYPRIFWRARAANAIGPWYVKLCDGMMRFADWHVFWIGLQPDDLPAALSYALAQPVDLP